MQQHWTMRLIGAAVLAAMLSLGALGTRAEAQTNKIAFVRSDDIWVMDPNGANQQQLTFHRSSTSPSWSPFRNAIVYSRTGPRQADLWMLQFNNPGVGGLITGVTESQLTNDAGSEVGPEWSPDGSRILFFAGTQIWMYTISTGMKTQLTPSSEQFFHSWGSWSPDGQQIAYAGNGTIWVLLVGPSGPAGAAAPLAQINGIDLEWSREISGQSHIAMFYNNQVWVLDVTNNFNGTYSAGGVRQMTTFASSFPTWSPDGSQLAFEGLSSGPRLSGIFRIDLSGANLVQLTSSSKDGRAAWNR